MPAEEIKKNVVDNLYWDTRVDASDVDVEVSAEGEVTLKGSVPSFTSKTAATTSAWSVTGVSAVNNRLTVEYPAAVTVPSDEEIQDDIENILLWDTDIDSTKIDVSVNDNEVTLEGSVDAYWKIYAAERLADTTGVYSIENKLAVVPSEDEEDEVIAESIVNALTRNVDVNSEDVEVKVKNGEVTLRGTVSSWSAYRAAEESSFFTAGVTDVDNLIEIEY